jgi:hypothetical protein
MSSFPSTAGQVAAEAAPPAVQVFACDPDLLAGVDRVAAARLRRHGRARAVHVDRGRWLRAPRTAGPADLGLLVTDGYLLRQVRVGACSSAEVLGPGDVLRPWDRPAEEDLLTTRLTWHALQPATLAVLDARFMAAVAQHAPSVTAALLGRATARAWSLGVCLAVATVARADERLLLLFRHLADRFGRMTPAGVVVPPPLTHAAIAQMTGLQRPSASTALGRLSRRGVLVRRPDATWLLRPDGGG